jgi:hypothetical protein
MHPRRPSRQRTPLTQQGACPARLQSARGLLELNVSET